MKFILTENKLDSIIDSYLTKQFKNLEYHEQGNLSAWLDSDKKPIIIIRPIDGDETEIYISSEIFFDVIHMFSLKGFDELDIHLKKWFENHFGISSDEFIGINNDVTYEDLSVLFN